MGEGSISKCMECGDDVLTEKKKFSHVLKRWISISNIGYITTKEPKVSLCRSCYINKREDYDFRKKYQLDR